MASLRSQVYEIWNGAFRGAKFNKATVSRDISATLGGNPDTIFGYLCEFDRGNIPQSYAQVTAEDIERADSGQDDKWAVWRVQIDNARWPDLSSHEVKIKRSSL